MPRPESSRLAPGAFREKGDGIVDVNEQDPEMVMLHPTEAGDPYYIGDVYEDQPLCISQEWEIEDMYVLLFVYFEVVDLPVT